MDHLLKKLRTDFPGLQFMQGERARWSPETETITYALNDPVADTWSLLHELGHALLNHTSYHSDVSLLQKEAAAWQRASSLAQNYGLSINEDYVQNCLDTYRDWLHKRSSCPDCSSHGIQASQSLYDCPNCQNTWKVSSARFCRPYRLKSRLKA